MTEDDRLVRDYLRRLYLATRGMPRARRRELIDEITAHIAEASAAAEPDAGGAAAPPATAGGSIRGILARLGDPADIVRAAGGPVLASRPGGLEIAAVILLLVGGFVFLIGWVAGCVLLWSSPRWRWPDKLLGTLVWPGGLLAPFLVLSYPVAECVTGPGGMNSCAPSPPQWLAIALVLLVMAAPFGVAAWLVHRSRRLPEPAASETLTPVP